MGQVSIARGVKSRLRAGEFVALIVRMTPSPTAAAALDRVVYWLWSFNAQDSGRREPRGPSIVNDPIPLPDGYLLLLDPGEMTTRQVKAIPDQLVAELTSADVSGVIEAPAPWNDWNITFQQQDGFWVQAMAIGVWDPADLNRARRPDAHELLLQHTLDWLYQDGGDPTTFVGISGREIGRFTSRQEVEDVLTDVLPAGTGVEVFRRSNTGQRYFTATTIFQLEFLLSLVPDDQSPADVAAELPQLIAVIQPCASLLDWAGADTGDNNGPHKGVIGMASNAPSTKDEGYPEPVTRQYGSRVPGAYPWQILTSAHRAQLQQVLDEATETPLADGRVAVAFEPFSDWARNSATRAPKRAHAQAVFDPIIGNAFYRATSRELQANLALGGLSHEKVADDLGLSTAQLNRLLSTSLHGPVKWVWLLRDYLDAELRRAAVVPVPYTKLTEEFRPAAAEGYPLEGPASN